jgi:putative radical SAM enzyme (TIGR03279 family)
MKELRFFRDNRIHMHTQIVLCPGYNDGEALKRTIRDLGSLYPYLESVAVVPVGLTAHGKSGLSPVGKEDAVHALEAVDVFQKRFRKKHGDPVVYASDELYIRAGRPLPPIKDYGELPQVENGVGMVAEFMARARRLRPSKPSRALRYLTFTGVSFHPYMKKFMDRLESAGFQIKAVPVENAYFGNSITVTGLLTGRDVIRALSSETRGFDALLIPAVVLRDGGDVFLDDVRVAELERALGLKALVVEPTPEALLGRLTGI